MLSIEAEGDEKNEAIAEKGRAPSDGRRYDLRRGGRAREITAFILVSCHVSGCHQRPKDTWDARTMGVVTTKRAIYNVAFDAYVDVARLSWQLRVLPLEFATMYEE